MKALDMTQRYRKFKRSWGMWYAFDNATGNSESLKTRVRAEAEQKVNAMNETERVPSISLGLAKVYLNATDPKLATRTWQEVMENIVAKKNDETRRRWDTAIKDRNYDCIRRLKVAETRPEHFDRALADGKVSTNVYPDQISAEREAAKESAAPRVESLLAERHFKRSRYLQSLARRAGCRDHNDLWDHLFETRLHPVTSVEVSSVEKFIRDVAAWCHFARVDATEQDLKADGTLTREAAMATAIREELAKGTERIIVVTGGLARHALGGTSIGEVPPEAGVPPLVEDFRVTAQQLRLNIKDSIRRKSSLDLYRKASHRQSSRFFHSLVFLEVPFAILMAGPDFVRGIGLERLFEHWGYQWTPRTESRLVEASVYGATVEEAAANRLVQAIAELEDTGRGRCAADAVGMLVHACRMGLHRHTGRLLKLDGTARAGRRFGQCR